MGGLIVLALTLAGPGPEEPEPEAEPSAWEAAGWGAPEVEPEPEADPEAEAPPVEAPPPIEDAAPAQPEAPAREKVRVGDVLTGSLRLTGSFLHFDDEPQLFPNGDDAMALAVGMIIVEADAGRHVHFSFNGFAELSRSPFGAGLSGTFASTGSTRSAYRTRYLTWRYWESGSVVGQLGIDRAAMRLSFDSINLDLGRFPITYSVTGMFSTNDFFAPFSATAINRIYKPGVDAIRVSAGIGPTSSVDVIGVLGYDLQSDRPSWGHSAVLTRAAVVGAGFEWAALGGKVSQRWVAGGSLQGDAGPINLRAEFHVGIPDEEGDGHDRDDRPIYGRVAGGPSMMFAWQNAVLSAEYLFASDGASSPSGYTERALASYTDDQPYLGQHYVAAAFAAEIIPILRGSVTGLVNATDGSGLAGGSLIYNVADESDLILGAFVPWGRGLRGIDPVSGFPQLGSELGLSPLSVYLEARVFF
ncbi:MAG TPA: hypothetical protein VM869_36655 [Enhygromyxa sp.]|nr:hypothetical protein [Enhygromyxa sp.]